MKRSDDSEYAPEAVARRRDDAIRRALNTPPTPQKDMIGKGTGKGPRAAAGKRGGPKKSRSLDKGQNDP